MVIEVTREDILKGERGSATHCPIALACKRQLGEEVEVMDGLIALPLRGRPTVLHMDDKAARFVRGWDKFIIKDTCPSFTFETVDEL